MKEFEYWMAKVNEEAEKLVSKLDEANEALRKLSSATGELLEVVENEICVPNTDDTSEQ